MQKQPPSSLCCSELYPCFLCSLNCEPLRSRTCLIPGQGPCPDSTAAHRGLTEGGKETGRSFLRSHQGANVGQPGGGAWTTQQALLSSASPQTLCWMQCLFPQGTEAAHSEEESQVSACQRRHTFWQDPTETVCRQLFLPARGRAGCGKGAVSLQRRAVSQQPSWEMWALLTVKAPGAGIPWSSGTRGSHAFRVPTL